MHSTLFFISYVEGGYFAEEILLAPMHSVCFCEHSEELGCIAVLREECLGWSNIHFVCSEHWRDL